MKFSISFKYSNVTFKNKETKETVTFDSKAETGNTFTFDNVDEDVVIGMVKGIKDKKASQVFSYDDFRTCFINTMARNKCKELYDKMDKGGWKVEDVTISTITIKDLEFTKPTMNARENLTVESKKMKILESEEPLSIQELEVQLGEFIEKKVKRTHPIWADLADVYEKYFGDLPYLRKWKDDVKKRKYFRERRKKYIESDDVKSLALESGGARKERVVFRKYPESDIVIAFFPDTLRDGSCNRGCLMSYEHNGQHSEADLGFYEDCRPCSEREYADLLTELEGIYDDCELVVVDDF